MMSVAGTVAQNFWHMTRNIMAREKALYEGHAVLAQIRCPVAGLAHIRHGNHAIQQRVVNAIWRRGDTIGSL
jgi:hypothetical protein